MMQALRSYETSVLTRATRRNVPEDTILHNHGRGNLKSYMNLINLPNPSRRTMALGFTQSLTQ
jgi:hypothetical protein